MQQASRHGRSDRVDPEREHFLVSARVSSGMRRSGTRLQWCAHALGRRCLAQASKIRTHLFGAQLDQLTQETAVHGRTHHRDHRFRLRAARGVRRGTATVVDEVVEDL